VSTVYLWLMRHEAFSEAYARAREEQADTFADEISAIADEPPPNDEKGRTDSGWVAWQRNRIDARKWVAAKLKPKRYGEKVDVTSDGKAVGLAINIDLNKGEAA
jgi:hypothetical protein